MKIMAGVVDDLIKDVQYEDSKRQRAIRYEKMLRNRRKVVMETIGNAAKKHLPLGNVVDAEKILHARLLEARDCRVSKAEAIAALAEQGDFTSKLMWWDIRDENDQTLWKGYVLKAPVLYKDLVSYKLWVRKSAEKGYVALLKEENKVFVGVSFGESAKAVDAVIRVLDVYEETEGQSALSENVVKMILADIESRIEDGVYEEKQEEELDGHKGAEYKEGN